MSLLLSRPVTLGKLLYLIFLDLNFLLAFLVWQSYSKG